MPFHTGFNQQNRFQEAGRQQAGQFVAPDARPINAQQPIGAIAPQLGQIQPAIGQAPVSAIGQPQGAVPQGPVDTGFNPPAPRGGFPPQPIAGGNIQPQTQQAGPQQQFGLSGFENALTQGFGGAAGAINAGATNAVNTLGGSFGARAQQVDPQTGQPLFQQAAQGVNQFAGAGVQAQQQQAALSGALGPEAQQQAISAFNASPGQAFLREQGELGIINQATALGGRQGGNVLRELQRQGIGLAQQDFANNFDRLGQLSNQGVQAAGQAGQFLSQAGQQQGNLASTNAQLGTQANLASAANRLSARGQQAGFQNQQGVNIGNLFQGTGSQIGQGRLQAGRDIAGQIGGATSALSNLQNQQGTGLSNLLGSSASNIANLLSQSGQFTAQQQAQLAQLLSNSATGGSSQLANIALGQGTNQANLALGQGQNAQNLVGNLTGAAGLFLGQQTP